MNVKNRIKEFLADQNCTISGFEKSIDSSNGYVNSISKSIGVDKLKLIIEKYPNLNIEWLLTGEGEMLKSGHKKEGGGSDDRVAKLEKEVATLKEENSQLKDELIGCLKGRLVAQKNKAG